MLCLMLYSMLIVLGAHELPKVSCPYAVHCTYNIYTREEKHDLLVHAHVHVQGLIMIP